MLAQLRHQFVARAEHAVSAFWHQQAAARCDVLGDVLQIVGVVRHAVRYRDRERRALQGADRCHVFDHRVAMVVVSTDQGEGVFRYAESAVLRIVGGRVGVLDREFQEVFFRVCDAPGLEVEVVGYPVAAARLGAGASQKTGLLAQDHLRSRVPCRRCGHTTCCTATHDDDVRLLLPLARALCAAGSWKSKRRRCRAR